MPDGPAALSNLSGNVNAQAPAPGGVGQAPASAPTLEVLEKPWFQSRTIIAGIAIILAQALRALGVLVEAGDPALIETITGVVTAIAGGVAIYGRAKASRAIGPATKGAALGVLAIALLGLSGCETHRITGSLSVGYGGGTLAVGSDGKTTNIALGYTGTRWDMPEKNSGRRGEGRELSIRGYAK